MKLLSVLIMFVLAASAGLALTVESPLAGNTTSPVDVVILGNQTDLNFTLDNMSDGCTNCSVLERSLVLAPGEYILTTFDLNETIMVNFTVVANVTNVTNTTSNETNVTALNLTIVSPAPVVNSTNVTLSFATNKAGSILYTLGNDSGGCSNCNTYVQSRFLAYGNHTLTVNATVGNETVVKTRQISVVNVSTPVIPPNVIPNATNGSRFAQGFNKLPQAVENGEISDADLAAIIRTNALNPGVLNRLIKTGKLGNASLNAIIETQQTPPGIFRKLMHFFGVNYPEENIPLMYNVTDDQEAKIKQKVDSGYGKVPPGQAKKADAAGNSGKVPPGQAKK